MGQIECDNPNGKRQDHHQRRKGAQPEKHRPGTAQG